MAAVAIARERGLLQLLFTGQNGRHVRLIDKNETNEKTNQKQVEHAKDMWRTYENVLFSRIASVQHLRFRPKFQCSATAGFRATGLTAGQTAKLSVYYPTVPAPVAQVLAFVRLVIEDENRNVLAQQDFQVAAGQTVSVSVNGNSLLAADRRSAQIHAFTQTAGGAADAFPFVIPGLDIVDNTSGRTVVHLDTKVTYPRP